MVGRDIEQLFASLYQYGLPVDSSRVPEMFCSQGTHNSSIQTAASNLIPGLDELATKLVRRALATSSAIDILGLSRNPPYTAADLSRSYDFVKEHVRLDAVVQESHRTDVARALKRVDNAYTRLMEQYEK